MEKLQRDAQSRFARLPFVFAPRAAMVACEVPALSPELAASGPPRLSRRRPSSAPESGAGGRVVPRKCLFLSANVCGRCWLGVFTYEE